MPNGHSRTNPHRAQDVGGSALRMLKARQNPDPLIRCDSSWSSMKGRLPMKNSGFDGFTVNITFDEDGDWLAHLL